MQQYKKEFDTLIGAKSMPNEHELALFVRAKKYIQKISWIPGIEMIAIVNSLSMFATHRDSDIDLFIVTKPKMLWFVRFFVTITLYRLGVWRHGRDIAGNFCLSFFVTTDAMNMANIAIDHDIYFYYWIYYMKPVLVRGDIYERFLEENSWVEVSEKQKKINMLFLLPKLTISAFCHPEKVNSSEGGKETTLGCEGRICSDFHDITEADTSYLGMTKMGSNAMYQILNICIRFFFLPKTQKKYQKLGKPEGVIITDDMLKFHDQDRRREFRNKIFQKNFDK